MMNLRKFALTFSVFALAIASAASSYQVEISTPLSVGDISLKPGHYDVRMEADKVSFKKGKTLVEIPATFEKSPTKFKENQMSTVGSQLKDIEVGGTTTKIIFGSTSGGPAVGGK